ncbi:hypothetical protein SCACP_34850 [Sporomusa carbonis]
MHACNTEDIYCEALNPDEFKKKARKLACQTGTTIATGNSVVLFTMLLLQDILEQLAVDPITNLSNIITVANSIASLNSSIKIDP